jgi:hypothetical protein
MKGGEDAWVTGAEMAVLTVLQRAHSPLSIERVCSTPGIGRYEPVEIKIAALNLVSQGLALLTDRWELQASEEPKAKAGRYPVAA